MNPPKAAQQKVLFVGNKRLCPQIAYVLDVKDYDLAEKLTKQNYEQYCGYQIYVCEFKRKSHQFVQLKDKVITQLNIQYLDDICRAIDEAYYADRKRHKATDEAITAEPVVVPTTVPTIPNNENKPIKQPLWRRIRRGMKHPLRAAWHVVLRVKETVKCQFNAAKMKHCQVVAERERRRSAAQECRAQHKKQAQIHRQIRRGNWDYLKELKPSELLLRVISAPVNKNMHCTNLETNLRVNYQGKVDGCCGALVPFGNVLRGGELDEIYHSTYARIVKLSSLNGSYCLCNLNRWCKGYCSAEKSLPTKQWQTVDFPKLIAISIEKSCNLCCRQCRTKPYVMDEAVRQRTNTIVAKILNSGWLDQAKILVLAGNGEVFYSPYYRQLWMTELQREEINILSNGTLFNEDNWHLLAGKYTTIDVNISVDAATAETYQKVRGADFNGLKQNLTMLADLHRQKRIRKFNLNFVVQRANFREMPDFVRLGQSLGVDHIQFQRLNNLGTFTQQEFAHHCLIVDDTYLDYELWCILQDPIFRDPIVDLKGMQRYIDASEKRYRKRYAREQKIKCSV